jgi:uncharacterized protein YbjT (DUF2867 family)
MRIAVAGGTGLVGRYVVTALRDAGHEPVVLARSHGVHLTSGEDLDNALAGADGVIDVSNVTTTSKRKSVAFFGTATRHLLAAGHRAGIAHHVALSIVGVDRVDFGYYGGKRRQEELVLSGPVASSVLRATQFHEFTDQCLTRGRGPLTVVPQMRTMPVAAREVAAALVALASGPAVGYAPELAGPDEHQLVDLVRRVKQARGVRRALLPLQLPGQAGRAMAAGALLPTGPGPRGRQSFDEWLNASENATAAPPAP